MSKYKISNTSDCNKDTNEKMPNITWGGAIGFLIIILSVLSYFKWLSPFLSKP